MVCAAVLVMSLFIFTAVSTAEEGVFLRLTGDLGALKNDYSNFYLDTGNLMRLGAGLAAAGAVANTKADMEIQNYYQVRIRSSETNSISSGARIPGDVFISVPLLLGARIFLSDTWAGPWAQKSLRALFLGGPLGLALQRVTGAERPSANDSRWKPFKSSHGLSGHAFTGAVPFITAARMEDNVYLKSMFYGLSALPGLSRINDNAHYFSQAAIGWYLAYLSSSIIDKKTEGKGTFLIIPLEGGLELTFNAIF